MRFFIETLGCPKNTVDSEGFAGLLESKGHIICDEISKAEIIIINTCAFINDAKEESISTIFEAIEIKKEYEQILVVCGCIGKRFSKKLFKQIPEIDILVGVNDYEKLAEILSEKGLEKKTDKLKKIHLERLCLCEEEQEYYIEQSERKLLGESYHAYLKISEGCNNRCTYCVIPSIRGKFRSRKKEDILAEARRLADIGVKEITIVAQDVTAYGIDIYDSCMLPALIENIAKIEEIKWVRLMYCYPEKITDELIEVMAKCEKVCKYIDIPIQHADDKILKQMGRKSRQAGIREVIKKLRAKITNIHIRTTLITGFPGETAKEFAVLYDFVNEVQFDRLGVFAYSKEENTPAAKMAWQVNKKVKEKRRDKIMEAQRKISLLKNQAKVGETYEVLIEEKQDEMTYIGRTQFDAIDIDNSVIVSSDRELRIGDFVKVKITDAFDYDLIGQV